MHQATKAHVRLSTQKLYGADGYAVRELLKASCVCWPKQIDLRIDFALQVTSLLYHADRQSKAKEDSGAPPVSLSDFDINTKLGDLKVS